MEIDMKSTEIAGVLDRPLKLAPSLPPSPETTAAIAESVPGYTVIDDVDAEGHARIDAYTSAGEPICGAFHLKYWSLYVTGRLRDATELPKMPSHAHLHGSESARGWVHLLAALYTRR
jgi:hypothetical protein